MDTHERNLWACRSRKCSYEKQAVAVGQAPLALIEIMKKVSDGHVKITPDIVASGDSGDGASNTLAAFMGSLLASNARLSAIGESPAKV